MTPQRLGWIALNLVPGIGPVLFQRLIAAYGSAEAVFLSEAKNSIPVPGISPSAWERLRRFSWQEAAEREESRCQRLGCELMTLADPAYPEQLKGIAFPPPVLYVLGTLDERDQRAVAVVGCRQASLYGLAATRTLVTGLVTAGFTVVSGLARGVDAEAHRAALEAGGRTVAVLAHGVDQVYPREHRRLAERIKEHGALISEFPIGVPPVKPNFPRRNRLISGLSEGVLVTEAGERSGSLITARWAVEQGRDVFAVPGGFNAERSQGPHALIQDGAKLVTRVEDIFAELAVTNPSVAKPQVSPEIPEALKPLVDVLRLGPRHVDQLAVESGLPVQRVMADLLDLELRGLVRSAPGQVYQCR